MILADAFKRQCKQGTPFYLTGDQNRRVADGRRIFDRITDGCSLYDREKSDWDTFLGWNAEIFG
jgi:hypothetical protein